jgi:hypothetical protein
VGAGLGSLVGAVGGVAAAGGAATLGKRKDSKYNFVSGNVTTVPRTLFPCMLLEQLIFFEVFNSQTGQETD